MQKKWAGSTKKRGLGRFRNTANYAKLPMFHEWSVLSLMLTHAQKPQNLKFCVAL